MRVPTIVISLVSTYGVFLGPTAVAEEPPARAEVLIEAAVRAHGGEASLQKWSNMSYEGEITFFFGTSEIKGTGEIYVRDGRMIRRDAHMTFSGTPFESNEGSTGKSAWMRRRSRVYDYPVDNYNTWLSHRPDILSRAAADPATLTVVGTADLDGDPVTLVDFGEDQGTTRILLDSETGLVRGLEYRAMDNRGDGNPEEVFFKKTYADYRPVEGIPFPHLIEEYRKGSRQLIVKVTGAELGAAPEVAMFAKPEADEEAKEWFDQIAN